MLGAVGECVALILNTCDLCRYYGVNLKSELDAPGEYYIERSSGMVYFYPPPGAAPSAQAFVSVRKGIVHLDSVRYVTLSGLQLMFSQGTAVVGSACDHVIGFRCGRVSLGDN